MALVTAAEVKAWVQGDGTTTISGVNDSVLTLCIAVAGELIVDETSRIWEVATVSEAFDGDAADGPDGSILRLTRFPVTYPTDPITVAENGVSLVVAAGYSLTAGVIVKGAQLESPCHIVRRPGGWAPGVQNIVATYKAGYVAAPERIKFVAKELAWLVYQQGRKTGVETVTESGSSRRLISELSWASRRILEMARRF